MNDEKLVLTKAAVFEVGLLFNQQPSDEKIKAYAKALQNYTPKQITFAFNQVILSGSAFFPSLAEVLKHLRPQEPLSKEIGNHVANEIIQKVIDYGSHRLQEAYESLSEIAKKTLGENTYLLSEIANSERDSLPSIRAQIRDMVIASSESNKASGHNEKLEKIGIDTKKVLSLSKPEFKTMDYSGFLPGANS